jgi:hypothetical protein
MADVYVGWIGDDDESGEVGAAAPAPAKAAIREDLTRKHWRAALEPQKGKGWFGVFPTKEKALAGIKVAAKARNFKISSLEERPPLGLGPAGPKQPGLHTGAPGGPKNIIAISGDVFLKKASGGYFMFRKIGRKTLKIGRIFRRVKEKALIVMPLRGANFSPTSLEVIRTRLQPPDSTYQVKLVPQKAASQAIAQARKGVAPVLAVRKAASVAKAVVPALSKPPTPPPPVSPFMPPEAPPGETAPAAPPSGDMFSPPESPPPEPPEELPTEGPPEPEEVETPPEEEAPPETDEEEPFEEEAPEEEISEEEVSEDEAEVTGMLWGTSGVGAGPRHWDPWHRDRWEGPKVQERHMAILGKGNVAVSYGANGHVEIVSGFDGADDADEVSSEGNESEGGF